MNYIDNKAENIKIAYVGGGSRGWAWGLMSDLVACDDISGDVYLYDIDMEAAKHNEIIGNMYNDVEGAKSHWTYHASETAKEAMTGADFVVISILPGTFDEMHSDVHTPEKYGIYQTTGDSTGPGGIVRAMRTIPMFEEIAGYVRDYCPNAWVINYTNPMTLCVKTLYRVFPEIKAFGCCHEVFGTQKFLAQILKETYGIENIDRSEIKVTPTAVNHFTWLTSAQYRNIDLFPVYEEFVRKHAQGVDAQEEKTWVNLSISSEKVKMDLFRHYGYIAAAGDRHLAEFCPGKWYSKDPDTVAEWGFNMISVPFRKEDLARRKQRSEDIRSGAEKLKIECTGEEGVRQIRALLGLEDLVTNVNIPNVGQIPNLPMGAVVETNAAFRSNHLDPVLAGNVPVSIYPMVTRICAEQEAVSEAIAKRDVDAIFNAFVNDPLVTCSYDKAKELFMEMCENTKTYLGSYDLRRLR